MNKRYFSTTILCLGLVPSCTELNPAGAGPCDMDRCIGHASSTETTTDDAGPLSSGAPGTEPGEPDGSTSDSAGTTNTHESGTTDGQSPGDSDRSTSDTGFGATDTDGDASSGGVGICGDGNVDPGETCDDGNADSSDECLPDCTRAFCGDGFIHVDHEQCDTAVENGTCSADCREVGSCDLGYEDCDGLAANGCEVALEVDSQHCGFCSRDCLDGMCTDGECEATLIAGGVADVRDMMLSPTDIFVSRYQSGPDGSILRIPKSGQGVAVPVATGLNFPGPMILDGTWLIWASRSGGDIYRVPVSGGSSSILLDREPGGITDLAANSGYLYFAKGVGLNRAPSVGRVPIGGGSQRTFQDDGFVGAIDLDSQNFFWLSQRSYVPAGANFAISETQVRQSRHDGSRMLVLAGGDDAVGRDLVAGRNGRVYWTVGTRVMTAEANSGNPEQLVDLGATTGNIVRQAEALYVTTENPSAIYHVALADGTASTLATGFERVAAMRADDTHVYFVADNAVYRVAH